MTLQSFDVGQRMLKYAPSQLENWASFHFKFCQEKCYAGMQTTLGVTGGHKLTIKANCFSSRYPQSSAANKKVRITLQFFVVESSFELNWFT